MSKYTADRAWSDKYLPAIKQIVGPLLLVPAPFEIDANQATDLIVLTAMNMTIAARVRRHGFADHRDWGWQFTVRARRDSGAPTELEKLTNGWAQWMFYGHASARDDGEIVRWFVIDLNHWRAAMIRRSPGRPDRGDQPNGDGTYFKWFDLRTFPEQPPILIASSHPLPAREYVECAIGAQPTNQAHPPQ